MSATPPATLRDVRRGDEPDELYLLTSDNRAVILVAYGLTPDEKIRTAGEALRLLRDLMEIR